VDEPFFTLSHLNPSLKAGAGFQNQHQPSGWWSNATNNLALAVNSLLSSFHSAAHAMFVLF